MRAKTQLFSNDFWHNLDGKNLKVIILAMPNHHSNIEAAKQINHLNLDCAIFAVARFDEEVQEDDTIIENKGASLLVDPLSYQYLVGAKIDYLEGLEGSRFVVDNPMAATTCGCGASFSI